MTQKRKRQSEKRPCCHGSYLGIVLKHLIALHVVTLEHDDGPVEAGNIQAEVVCADFFVRRVREHLVKRAVKKKKKHQRGQKHKLPGERINDFIYELLSRRKKSNIYTYLFDFARMIHWTLFQHYKTKINNDIY